MKNVFKYIVLICVVSSSLAFSSCKEKTKYTADKYNDITYGEHERQKLDLYLPKEKIGETVGLILLIHGGSWIGGDKSVYESKLDNYCGKYGYAAAAINYHYISSEFYSDDIMQDIFLSLTRIKEFALEKGFNIEKVMLTGSSAGGHLALLYAYKYAETSIIKPVAVANYSGPTDLSDSNYYVNNENASSYLDLFSLLSHTTFNKDNYLNDDSINKMLEFSPVSYVNEKSVPTIICHGKKDDIVPYSNAEILKQRLDFYNVKSDLITYNNSGHSLSNDKKQREKATKLFLQYAQTYLN